MLNSKFDYDYDYDDDDVNADADADADVSGKLYKLLFGDTQWEVAMRYHWACSSTADNYNNLSSVCYTRGLLHVAHECLLAILLIDELGYKHLKRNMLPMSSLI